MCIFVYFVFVVAPDRHKRCRWHRVAFSEFFVFIGSILFCVVHFIIIVCVFIFILVTHSLALPAKYIYLFIYFFVLLLLLLALSAEQANSFTEQRPPNNNSTRSELGFNEKLSYLQKWKFNWNGWLSVLPQRFPSHTDTHTHFARFNNIFQWELIEMANVMGCTLATAIESWKKNFINELKKKTHFYSGHMTQYATRKRWWWRRRRWWWQNEWNIFFFGAKRNILGKPQKKL